MNSRILPQKKGIAFDYPSQPPAFAVVNPPAEAHHFLLYTKNI